MIVIIAKLNNGSNYIPAIADGCSFEEAGRYLETYKSFESKPPDLIMEKSEGTYMSRVNIFCHWLLDC